MAQRTTSIRRYARSRTCTSSLTHKGTTPSAGKHGVAYALRSPEGAARGSESGKSFLLNFRQAVLPQQLLNFLPDPQGQGSFRPAVFGALGAGAFCMA